MKKLIAPFLLAASLLTPAASFAKDYFPDSFETLNQSQYNPNARIYWDNAQFWRPSDEARSDDFTHTIRYYINENNLLIRVANVSTLLNTHPNKFQIEVIGFMGTQVVEYSVPVIWSIQNGQLTKTFAHPYNETFAIAGPRN